MAKAPRNPDAKTVYTPKGELRWPKLTEPDTGTDAFPDPDGSYKTDIVFNRSAPGVEKFLAMLDKSLERAAELAEQQLADLPLKSRKALEAKGGIKPDAPYVEEYDEDTEEPTGRVIFKAKKKASGTRKKDGKPWTSKVDLFDAKGNPFKRGKTIWGGSTAILSVELAPYFIPGSGAYGLRRSLNAAQIISLVSEGGSRSASSYGFQAQEGYDGSTEDTEEEEEDDDQTGDDASDDLDDVPF